MNVHQLLEPSPACHRLGHRVESRPKAVGAGRYDYCYVCSLGYEMAMERFGGDEHAADEFVRSLRT